MTDDYSHDLIPTEDGSLQPAPDSGTTPDFDTLIDLTLNTMAETSRRVYAQTYVAWADWCDAQGIDYLALLPENVRWFLIDQPVTRTTRRRMLSALRKAAELLVIIDYLTPEREVAYELIRRLKVPTESVSDAERPKVALTPEESIRAIHVWYGDDPRFVRNRALIAVLLLTGARRSEIAALKWTDVDLGEGVITIRHGKRDKAREASVFGSTALHALEAWRDIQGGNRDYVFCRVYKSGKFGPDTPLQDTAIYRVVKETEELADLPHFSPHDGRRTLATEPLVTGAPVQEVQAQLGHASPSQTLEYAQSVDARERRKRGRVRYGETGL